MEPQKHHFIQIINNNRGTIRSLCRVYYPGSEDQKDAFQDIILQLWKSFDTFRGEANISTWIYRVSLNTILNKKRNDQKSISVEPMDTLHQNVCTANADDNLELLYILIQSLKDIDKAIVVLYLEGYQNKEIAEILKMSTTNVATRFNRLKSELKKFNTKPHAAKRS
jgi:RNA polymerase sigma-70 factor (ECF subfamily)